MAKLGKRGRKSTPRARRGPVAPPRPDADYLELAMRAINEGIYDWNIRKGTIYYSEGVHRATGMTPRHNRTPGDWRRRIHPEDLPRYDAALIAHFKGKSERFECDYRFRALDGSWRWARQHGIAVRDEKGRAIRMVGSTGDITPLKQAEQALKESQERLALATQAATEGIYDWDIATGSLYLSDRARDFFAFPGKRLTPASWNARVHKEDFPAYREAVTRCLKGRTKRLQIEYRIRDAKSGWRWIFDRGVAVRNAEGRAMRLVGAVSDITQRKNAEAALRAARDEATEALKQQTATAEILKVISKSPADVKPTFNAILESTTRVCESSIAALFLYDGKDLTCAAHHNTTAAFAKVLQQMRSPPSRETPTRLAALKRQVIHVHDYLHDRRFKPLPGQKRENSRTMLSVPLLRDGSLVGVITTWRREVRPFSDKHIALLQTFADQAVIAIENVRLFNETREALERQTATAEVLRVISSSPTDVQPVFDAIAQSAARLCDGWTGAIIMRDGDLQRLGAVCVPNLQDAEPWSKLFPLPFSPEKSLSARAILEKELLEIPDTETAGLPDLTREGGRRGRYRAAAFVPLVREGVGIGVIALGRPEAGFTLSERQKELIRIFADQAVIAIENVRLFNETKEALERQRATADVLASISGSMADTQPVFERIVQNLRRLLGTRFAVLQLLRDDRMVEMPAVDGEGMEGLRARYPRPLDETTVGGRAMLTRQTVQVTPVIGNPDAPSATVQFAKDFGFDSVIFTPMIHEGKVIGAISAAHVEPRPFDDRQVALLRTFADQAVIAIQNVKLFNETREALERQTAISEVLRVISDSPGDVMPVMQAVAERAARICDAKVVDIVIREGDMLRVAATVGELGRPLGMLVPLNRETVMGRSIVDGAPVQVADLQNAPKEFQLGRDLAIKYGHRSILAVPLMREGRALGTILVRRAEVRPFEERHVALLQTFADQAAIAIANVRLFNETREALERQTATAGILSAMSGSMTDAKPVFEAIVKSCGSLFPGSGVALRLLHGGMLHVEASVGFDAGPVPVDRGSGVGACILQARTIHLPDLEAAVAEFPRIRQLGLKYGYHSGIYAPLLREGVAIGTIAVLRQESGGFRDEDVALFNTFADQAVIAIENVRLFNETREALERQTATAEILKVIASSPSDVQPVFDAIAHAAMRLIGGFSSAVARVFDNVLQLVAFTNTDEPGNEAMKGAFPMPVAKSKAARTGMPLCVSDTEALPDSAASLRDLARVRGFRSIVIVPMVQQGKSTGTISVTRREPGEFTQHQVELLKTFADQAVIAIENVRMFNETREALEKQTATADILQVLSGSPSDTQPVFDAIVRHAARLCDSTYANVFRFDGERIHLAASQGNSPEALAALHDSYPTPPNRKRAIGRVIESGHPVHIEDTFADADYDQDFAGTLKLRRLLGVPLLRAGRPVGGITVGWAEPGSIRARHEDLLKTFADQAVIAIENVRLFNETKEALERQTATAEILKVISSSPTDVQPVFEAIVQSAARLFVCGAAIQMRDGDQLQLNAMADFRSNDALFEKLRPLYPLPFDPEASRVSRAMQEGRILEVPDIDAPGAPRSVAAVGRAAGFRAAANAPLLRADNVIGMLSLTWPDPGHQLDDKQRGMLRTFADQAVIAIENVRLFKELQQRIEQMTALREVGQAISSTLDLETVLKTIVARAVQLTGMHGGTIYEFDEHGGEFHLRAAQNMREELAEVYRRMPIRLGEGVVGSAAAKREPVQVPDIQDPGYQTRYRELLIREGYRAILAVPLLREEQIIGALTVNRNEPGAFAPEVVELLKTFATQSAMAIQNARLFREIAEKGTQLEVASHHKSQFLASMSHELRTPLNAILGFNEMVLDQVYGDISEDVRKPLENMQTSGKHLLRLINNVLDLAKIEAGRMELALSDYSVQDTVTSVHSTLKPLAAEKGLEFVADVPQDIPLAHGDGGRIAQCLMNLAGNSLKFTKSGRVAIAVAQQDGLLRYSVADTGIGIPAEKIGSLFTEFKQTDATIASEYGGTGLGLSITKKFIEMHGGRIWVESEPGKGSRFLFEVPLRVQS